ncbi:MAG: pyridoxal-phosphate dependent enzyme, partial [Clostridia bacterium]|nr:pyridoxal-phosphate dependent enzyme [Clostridia bacterium]
VIVGCAGGGSNLGGLIAPFVAEKLQGKSNPQIIAVEPSSCPSLTRGTYRYDFCDTGKICPQAKMYTLGCDFIPSPNHAGGLRYHGMSPVLSKLYDDKLMKAKSYTQTEVFEAAVTFARIEGTLPAPESSHAIKGAIDAALECKRKGEKKVIVFGLTGTGYFDMKAYDEYLSGKMTDHIPTDKEIGV